MWKCSISLICGITIWHKHEALDLMPSAFAVACACACLLASMAGWHLIDFNPWNMNNIIAGTNRHVTSFYFTILRGIFRAIHNRSSIPKKKTNYHSSLTWFKLEIWNDKLMTVFEHFSNGDMPSPTLSTQFESRIFDEKSTAWLVFNPFIFLFIKLF